MTAVNVTVVSVIAGLTRNLCQEKEAFWTPSTGDETSVFYQYIVPNGTAEKPLHVIFFYPLRPDRED
jgi:hypothetical protein